MVLAVSVKEIIKSHLLIFLIVLTFAIFPTRASETKNNLQMNFNQFFMFLLSSLPLYNARDSKMPFPLINILKVLFFYKKSSHIPSLCDLFFSPL